MGYKAKQVLILEVDGKEVTVEPNAVLPEYGIVKLTQTAILEDTETGLEVVVEAGANIPTRETFPPSKITDFNETEDKGSRAISSKKSKKKVK